jgi:hypothetical protein
MTDTTQSFEQIPTAPRKRRDKKAPEAPAVPTVAERVAKLRELPYNALQEEIIEAHNRLLAALQGDS